MKEYETLVVTDIFVELKMIKVIDNSGQLQKELAELQEICPKISIQGSFDLKLKKD